MLDSWQVSGESGEAKPSRWQAARHGFVPVILFATVLVLAAAIVLAEGRSTKRVPRTETAATAEKPNLGRNNPEEIAKKSRSCVGCHNPIDSVSMHPSQAVTLGCADCHGGNSDFAVAESLRPGAPAYEEAMKKAHVHPLPENAEEWKKRGSANPERSYTLLNRESLEFVQFVNPSDYRVARKTCGGDCHGKVVEASMRSMHATGAMFWGGASYNNGILPFKKYILGEAYTSDGLPAAISGPTLPKDLEQAADDAGILQTLQPLPPWEAVKPSDIFRVFERGGRNINNLFPETGLPNAAGQLQRIEEPGRPDFRQSNRGPGTGARIAVPLINIAKTRLNDPMLWFSGTNDQPGDYRQSGCAACHVVYANDRNRKHSGPYAAFGNEGKSQTLDPTIDKTKSGHPLKHTFTRAVPTSQCMICHMHQPNMFMNSFMGYTMWDYESDAPAMWPEQQQYPSPERIREVLDRNPEGAAPRGKWADVDFLKNVRDLNPTLKDTQFADYHGHGWNFRAVFKRDRAGNLLSEAGEIIADDAKDKWHKAVKLASTHMEKGMHCVDCHMSQDAHGNGYIYGEVAAAVEIDCKDCHGTATEYPNLYTSGPAALGGGTDLANLRTPGGKARFEWDDGKLIQRSMVDPDRFWEVSLVKNSVTAGSPQYNEKAARAKLMGRDTSTQKWGSGVAPSDLAHSDSKMECYSCHTSWTTSCAGCHLPIEANAKTERHHYEGGETRNYATYNPQVARDDMFLLGRREPSAGGKIAPVRSSSALVLSSTNANRERIYVQQPPIAASGYSSQAFNPHYPHTERKVETKTCSDCHLSEKNDNNAIMAQLLMFGTGFVNFVGLNAYVGGAGELNAVKVTEWDEPQAVIGSYLHKYAYPDWYKKHEANGRKLQEAYRHDAGNVRCLQLRGEYLFVAEGSGGFRVYDAASIANKGVSQRLITAPFSPLGQDMQVRSADATCIALPTNQAIDPARSIGERMQGENKEEPFHPMYNYAYITDSREGLILVDVNTLADGEPRNNNLKRAVTWNPGGVLNGARHITIGGTNVYVLTSRGLVIVSVAKPLQPTVVAQLALDDPRASSLQFRYLFVTTSRGLQTVDVTRANAPRLVQEATVPMQSAQGISIARTYAYVAAGAEGLVIVDIERPEAAGTTRKVTRFNAGGALKDSRDVIVGATNASLFAYVADGNGGLKVLQLMSPESQRKFYGFSPEPRPELVASYQTSRPALSLSRGLERDRAVDETGSQVAVFGRRGARPFTLEEMRRLFLDAKGNPWFVSDTPSQSTAR